MRWMIVTEQQPQYVRFEELVDPQRYAVMGEDREERGQNTPT